MPVKDPHWVLFHGCGVHDIQSESVCSITPLWCKSLRPLFHVAIVNLPYHQMRKGTAAWGDNQVTHRVAYGHLSSGMLLPNLAGFSVKVYCSLDLRVLICTLVTPAQASVTIWCVFSVIKKKIFPTVCILYVVHRSASSLSSGLGSSLSWEVGMWLCKTCGE